MRGERPTGLQVHAVALGAAPLQPPQVPTKYQPTHTHRHVLPHHTQTPRPKTPLALIRALGP